MHFAKCGFGFYNNIWGINLRNRPNYTPFSKECQHILFVNSNKNLILHRFINIDSQLMPSPKKHNITSISLFYPHNTKYLNSIIMAKCLRKGKSGYSIPKVKIIRFLLLNPTK
jgi:hypothetical protein